MGLGVGALVGLGVGALDGLGVGALVGFGVGALVGIGVGVSVGFELSDVFGVAVSGGSNVGVSETSGVGVSDASGVGVSEASGVGVSDCSGVGVRVGVDVSFFPEPLCESSLSGKEEALGIGFSGKTKLADKIIDSNVKSMIAARNRLMHLNNLECFNSSYSCFSVYQLLIALRVPSVPTSAQAARV